MKPLLLFLSALFFISIGCKKVYPTTEVHNDTTLIVQIDTTIVRDTTIYNNIKQIGLGLPTFNTADTLYIPTQYYSLQKFNIDYFPNADSVFFRGNIVLGNTDNVVFQLYDITDSIPIEGSNITFTKQNANTQAYYQSGNIVNSLPHKEISLGISMHNSTSGAFVGMNDAILFVYMK